MKQRIAIIEAVRTPMASAGKELSNYSATELGVRAVREVVERSGIDPALIDELIFGNVAQPPDSANIARVIALSSGLEKSIPAMTVNRNCASGMQSITTAADRINSGEAKMILCGGAESMSNIPFLYSDKMKSFFTKYLKSRNFIDKFKTLKTFKLNNLKPEPGIIKGLTDPVSGLIMGLTAEVLVKEFGISRKDQDVFAIQSHKKALRAIKSGFYENEIMTLFSQPDFSDIIQNDCSARENLSIEKLSRFKPYFDKKNGTVTIANTCPISDGAAAMILTSEKTAKQLKLKPLGYLRDYSYAGLEPERMGLGPVYATSKLLDKTKASMKDFKIIELNEAFAAQVIANEHAFSSKIFAQNYLGKSKPIGKIDPAIMNIDGGAIALGHPVGMTGARIAMHVLYALRRIKKNAGLATLCVGGGQGAALFLEVK